MSEEIIESVLTDFPDAVYYPKFRLMTWHPIGIFDAGLADNVRQFIEWEEYIQDAPFDRYTDLSGVTEVQVSLQRLSEVARRRRTCYSRFTPPFSLIRPIPSLSRKFTNH